MAAEDSAPSDASPQDPAGSADEAALAPTRTAVHRWLRPGFIAAAAVVAVLLIAAATVVKLRDYNNPAGPTLHGTPQKLTGLATPGPPCQLQVTDHGASPDAYWHKLHYAAIIHNPCPDMAVNVSVVVLPMARDGSRLGSTDLLSAYRAQSIAALAPGADTAIADYISDDPDSPEFPLAEAADVSVRINNVQWTTEKYLRTIGKQGRALCQLIDAHPHVRGVRLLKGEPYHGERDLVFTLATTRSVPDPDDTTVTVVARDRSGHIVTGGQDPLARPNIPLVSDEEFIRRSGYNVADPFPLWFPGSADQLTLTAYWLADGTVHRTN